MTKIMKEREIQRYIYGVVNSNSIDKDFGAGIYTVPYQDVSAVVSVSENVDYINMPKNVLAMQLIRHQRVIEGIMPEYAIIPMRLGTFAVDEDEVKDILERGYTLIKEVLEKIKDRVEIDVAATWSDFASIIKEAGQEKEINEFKERLMANPEAVTVDDQLKIGAMIKNALDEKQEECGIQIQTALKTVSAELKAHELMDEKMVINMAFLLDKMGQEDFDRRVEELDTRFAEKLNFRCVGPLPPYSFYTLEIQRVQFEEIDLARKRLGLNDAATRDEIKRAYQSKAFSSHPDRNIGTEKEFDELSKDYKLLLDYCQHDSCSFKEKGFKEAKKSVIVKLK